MLSFLTTIKNEILSCFDTYTTTDFKIMQFLFPAYRRFYIRGKDEDGNLIFACKYVTEEGLCSVYDKRLKMCKKYPASKIGYPGRLHEGCGYKVEDKSFEVYLNKKEVLWPLFLFYSLIIFPFPKKCSLPISSLYIVFDSLTPES